MKDNAGAKQLISSWVKSFSKPVGKRQELFDRLMADSYRQAFNMAYRLTSNRSEAEDLLQETFVRAFRFFHRYDESLPFSSWLYRIMTNIHIDAVRKKSRLKTVSIDQSAQDQAAAWELADEQASAETGALSGQLDEPFQLGLKAMNPEFRMAVVLADIECLSYEEIAEIMATSVGTVRSRIHRGRKQLKIHLEETAPDLIPGGVR